MRSILQFSLISILSLLVSQSDIIAQCTSSNHLSFAGSTQICQGTPTNLEVIGDFVNYFWSDGSDSYHLETDIPGEYTLVVTDQSGCTLSSSIEITEGDGLGLVLGGLEAVCNNNASRIYCAIGFDTYLWNTGETAQIIETSSSGTFSVTVMDTNGCTGEASLSVVVENDVDPPVFVTCPGDNLPLEITIGTNDSCDDTNPEIENQSGFPVSLLWVELDDPSDIPANVTDNGNNGAPSKIEYIDEISIFNCSSGNNTSFELIRTWRASDICGNQSECTQIIRLLDFDAPILVEGVDFFLNQDMDNPLGAFNFSALYCPYLVEWNNPEAGDLIDNCTNPGNILFTSTHNSGSQFDEGLTSVSYIVSDECGNTTEYIFDINIECAGCTDNESFALDCSSSIAECDINVLTGGLYCTPDYDGQLAIPFCNGGALNNPSYFNFIATSQNMVIQITPSNCSPGQGGSLGLQANIIKPCQPTICLASSGVNCYTDAFNFNSSNLTVGEQYQLVVDGCGGSECTWTMEISNAPLLEIGFVDEITIELPDLEHCDTDTDIFCTGTDIIFYPANMYDSNNYYCWSITDKSGVSVLNQNGLCAGSSWNNYSCAYDYYSCGPLALNFQQTGGYEICLEKIDNGCEIQTFDGKCFWLDIEEVFDVDFGTFDVCASNMPWEPLITGPGGATWQGDQTLVEGLNFVEISDVCGCNYSQSITLNIVDDSAVNYTEYFCGNDLSSYTNPSLGISWNDIVPYYNAQTMTANVLLPGGSTQTQFDGTACDLSASIQFITYNIGGAIAQIDGPDCNATLRFVIDQATTGSNINLDNIIFNWVDASGNSLGTGTTVDIAQDGIYSLFTSYQIPNGTNCSFSYSINATMVSQGQSSYYFDNDGDGFGDSNLTLLNCEQPTGYTLNGGDCDDSNPNIYPGAPEIENNNIDENCDGMDTITSVDADGDGFTNDVDCNDSDANINPLAQEIPNNDIDENCDGVALIIDQDNDGFNSDEDCDDQDPAINPAAVEIPNNTIDENCDGLINIVDEDNDGFNSDEDCNDQDPNINPSATEIPNNTIDENCDGNILIIDNDGDGWNSDIDCNDDDPLINPGALEIPNNAVDENCDGSILVQDNDNDGFNSDEDCNDQDPSINPNAFEIPNNTVDEDCDGNVLIIDNDLDGWNSDDDCDDEDPEINPAANEIPNNDVDENCDDSILIIDFDGDGWNSDDDCDDQDSSINPGEEEIPNNGVDENCDGIIDNTDATHDIAGNVIQLYPNPIQDILFIDSEVNLSYKIYSASNQLIQEGAIETQESFIKTSELPNGIYFIVLKNEQHKTTIFEKLVKI